MDHTKQEVPGHRWRRTLVQALLCLAASALSAPLLRGQNASDAQIIRRLTLNRPYFNGFGPNLRQAAAKGMFFSYPGRTQTALLDLPGTPMPPELPGDREVKRARSISDLVVLGSVSSKPVSSLSQDEKCIFTDYQLKVSEVLDGKIQASPDSLTEPESEITVALKGGSVEVDGQEIVVSGPDYPTLRPGHRYVLFLRYLPISDSYTVLEYAGFNLARGHIYKMDRFMDVPPGVLEQDTNLLLQWIRESIIHGRQQITPHP